MSISESNRFARTQRAVQEQAVTYPAVFHFRIIVEAESSDATALGVVLAEYRVTAPLAASRASAEGRYQAYSVSVEIQSQAELHAFDAAVKRVPGVRMML
jgi:putative lipoic acid-binding regulatory protein